MNSVETYERKWGPREWVLCGEGLALILGEFIRAEILNYDLHFGFIVVGLSLCGVSGARYLDKIP